MRSIAGEDFPRAEHDERRPNRDRRGMTFMVVDADSRAALSAILVGDLIGQFVFRQSRARRVLLAFIGFAQAEYCADQADGGRDG